MLWTSIAEWMNFNSVNRKFSLDDWTAFLPIFYPSLCEPVQVQHFEFFVLCWSSNFSIFDPFPAAAWKALWFVTFFFFLLLFSSFTLIYIADIYLMCLFVSSSFLSLFAWFCFFVTYQNCLVWCTLLSFATPFHRHTHHRATIMSF